MRHACEDAGCELGEHESQAESDDERAARLVTEINREVAIADASGVSDDETDKIW